MLKYSFNFLLPFQHHDLNDHRRGLHRSRGLREHQWGRYMCLPTYDVPHPIANQTHRIALGEPFCDADGDADLPVQSQVHRRYRGVCQAQPNFDLVCTQGAYPCTHICV